MSIDVDTFRYGATGLYKIMQGCRADSEHKQWLHLREPKDTLRVDAECLDSLTHATLCYARNTALRDCRLTHATLSAMPPAPKTTMTDRA